MTDNPFSSETFVKIWSESFGKQKTRTKIKGIGKIEFYEQGRVFINLGKTITKGIYYTTDNAISLKGKTCLVYDVPSYFACPLTFPSKGSKLKKIKQYPGFLIELHLFNSLQDFMQKKFKKSSRYKLNKYRRRLTQCFEIKYKMYRNEMGKSEFELIFEKFKLLLQKRFEGKGEHNNNLDHKEWKFYKKVAFPMIQKGDAGLFTIFNGDEPIAITLTYFSKDIIFDAITVFNIDYAKFHLGSVNIMLLIQWGIENQFKILDFSKGYFDYKTRWATKQYDFEYHILSDPKSPMSIISAFFLGNFFAFKQYLRERNLNLLLSKFRFALKSKKKDAEVSKEKISKRLIFKNFDPKSNYSLTRVDANEHEVKKMLFEFLYLYGEASKNVVIYKIDDMGQYLFKGSKTDKIASFT
ncbi:GNAT family N-acetyltransferase [Muricauda sp. JGD-17]|uniref:GNAT family N-acetyltransferase n=1 Tax=Flagellimonas ochracea TaxID=2696472 RepID=A0A964TAH2_9FLAO|nr:GNAT family N-acetyltransferase [Allomuricauda ochracea]NAY90591.1 GNAT family N-acetyltransferase [Allomuricauda ochracea]